VLDDPRVFEFRTIGQIIAALHAVPAEQKKSTDVVVLQLHKFATDDLLEALHGFGHVFNLVNTEKDLKFAVERGANGAWVPVHFTPLSLRSSISLSNAATRLSTVGTRAALATTSVPPQPPRIAANAACASPRRHDHPHPHPLAL
jgi:hypothetical protein